MRRAQAGGVSLELGLLCGAGDGNRTRMTSLEEMLGELCLAVLGPAMLVACSVVTLAARR
jgi:hypothetical protein